MKEAITKFDLEAAFKALDEIEVPAAEKGIKANRPALTEIFSRKSKFDALMEEYYDISSPADLEDAQEAREAEVAKAKLERIEKIVDLDADSPEDLLTSYVGKHIIQCPQCMTLFYKDLEDIVESEEDSKVVNVNEICQHCGNEDGYTLIGKVGEAEPGEFEKEPALDVPDEEIPTEAPEEEPAEDASEESEDIGDLEDINLDLDIEDDEEKKEESFNNHEGEALVEELSDDPELDDKLKAQDEYVEYLRAAINSEKEKLEKESNEQIKAAIQRNIEALDSDLQAAVPDAVKNGEATVSNNTSEEAEIEDAIVDAEVDSEDTEVQEESCNTSNGDALTESLREEADLDVSADEFKELISSPEFKKPISSAEVNAILSNEDENVEDVEECAGDSVETAEPLTEAITRSGKCDWVLNKAVDSNGQKKYDKFAVVSLDGKKVPDALNAPAKTFKAKYISKEYGAKSAPKYKDAENLAKGNSMKRDCGPVLIYLVKGNTPTPDGFLCQYVNGQLHSGTDQLDSFIRDIKGGKKAAKANSSANSEKRAASELKPNDKIKLGDDVVKVASVEASKFNSALQSIKIELEDGSVETIHIPTKQVFTVVIDNEITFESFNSVMANLDELHESTLEAAISNLLVESYKNVAGFRLSSCDCSESTLAVSGTIHFTSGNTRKTTYAFNESYNAENGKISLVGLNKKLGLDKQFTLTGRIENKTLITESFTRNR